MRLRTLSAIICSLTIIASAASSALAASTGGVAPGTGATSTTGAANTSGTVSPAPRLHLSPVTARSSNIAYHGPVYVRTPSGEVVPYQPAASSTEGVTGHAASASGGSSPAGPSGAGSPEGEPASGETAGSEPASSVAPKPELLVPGTRARYVAGLAAAPMSAPAAVQQVVWAANQIVGLPYIFGGGHASFNSPGYDCSGTVSFALHAGRLLTSPEDSSELMGWGSHGIGRWVSVFSNAGHAYMTVAGLRLDTSSADDPSNQQGPRWRPLRRANGGFTVRHPLGL